MSNYRTEIYTQHNGVQMTLVWPNEREFWLGQQFLQDMAGPTSTTRRHPDDPEFYYLTTEAQFEALLEFRRKPRDGEL